MNDDLLRQIAREYMQRMGIKDTQYIVSRHLDTDHVHLHIVANRVDDNFGRISDARDLERKVIVCKALTREYRLTLGKDKQKVKRSHLRGRDAAKYRIYDAIQAVLTPGMGWRYFCRALKAQGIETHFQDIEGMPEYFLYLDSVYCFPENVEKRKIYWEKAHIAH